MQLVGADPDKDTAVLQLDISPDKARQLKPVTLGASQGLFVGQKVFALGNPVRACCILASNLNARAPRCTPVVASHSVLA